MNMRQILQEIADAVGGTVSDNYSGRGMFGKECCGIVCSNPNECIEEAASRGVKKARTDNMGKDYIVYWPEINLSSRTYTVRYTVEFETKITCLPEEIDDLAGDVDIPENSESKYVEDSFEIVSTEEE